MPDRVEKIVEVKSWQALLTLITMAVLCVLAYARLDSQAAENQRRIMELENRPIVTNPVYENGQRMIEQRLERIERKIDNVDAGRRH